MKRCIISLATEHGDFQKGIERLRQSLKSVKFRGEFISWKGSYPRGCPSHLDAPFAFKPFCFKEASQLGYDSLLWADASVVAIRPVEPIFNMIEQKGYAFFRNDSLVLGEWCSDMALDSFDLSREEALALPEANAAVIGLSMKSQLSQEFLREWSEKSTDGVTFRGIKDKLSGQQDYLRVKWNIDNLVSSHPRVHGHRHDQSALGIIAFRLGMELSDANIVTCRSPLNKNTIIYIDRDVNYKAKPFNKLYLFYIFVIEPLIKSIKKGLRNLRG